MGRHHEPDSGFDAETDTWPDWEVQRLQYRRGLLDGVIATLVIVLFGTWVYYLIMNWDYLIPGL